MDRLILFGAVVTMLASDVARAQLSVQVRCDRDTFLLYESIPVAVAIRNFSGRTIQLEDSDGKPWLGFIITDEAGSLVTKVGELPPQQSALAPSGQTITRTVDLSPLYDLRLRGTYKIQAVIDTPAAPTISPPLRLTIINGREIWSQTVGLPTAESAPDEYRTYSLVARRSEKQDLLHVCVRDDQRQVVYGLLPLGGFIAMADPQVRPDRDGHLHVLYQIGPRAFGYAHVDSSARLIERAVYSDFLSKPRLVAADGVVRVRGGEQTYPKSERVMSEQDLTPPPPPPKPKKKWWWPFGSRTTIARPASP